MLWEPVLALAKKTITGTVARLPSLQATTMLLQDVPRLLLLTTMQQQLVCIEYRDKLRTSLQKPADQLSVFDARKDE